MGRTGLSRLWKEAWESGLWAAAWSRSLEGLTAQQAAWKPDRRRHSIWQIVSHVAFWRGIELTRISGGGRPPESEIERENFPDPAEINESAWAELRQRFRQSQDQVAAVLADEGKDITRIPYLLAHDCYHMGQIHQLRAMQGLPPIE